MSNDQKMPENTKNYSRSIYKTGSREGPIGGGGGGGVEGVPGGDVR